MIPRTVHYVWLGARRGLFDDEDVENISRFIKIHPEWSVRLWTMEAIESDPLVYEEWTSRTIKAWWVSSDFYRLKILHAYGGLYLDTDVEVRGSISEHLRPGVLTAAALPGRTHPNNCLLACEPGSRCVSSVLESYRRKLPNFPAGDQLNERDSIAGPSWLTNLPKDEVVVLPRSVLWDVHDDGQAPTGAIMIHRSRLRWKRGGVVRQTFDEI